MLLPNPHLLWGVPFLRCTEAKPAGPEATVYGTLLVGLPVIIWGFNKILGWSHTVNTVVVLVAYRLRLAEGGYRIDGEVRPFEEERSFRPVFGDSWVATVEFTPDGPRGVCS